MTKGRHLGDFELLTMLAVCQSGEDAYAVSVRDEIERRTGRDVSRGAVYAALERLERKALVSSEMGEATPERGGKPKRFYRPTEDGLLAVKESRDMLQRMWNGLDSVLEGS